MYKLFIGNYERAFGRIVYYKSRGKFYPATVKNYSYNTRKYTLKPIEDKGKTIYRTEIYFKESD